MAQVNSISRNKDIDYIEKDFDSTVDALISFANVQFGPGTSANRLWTNFNVDSFSRTWLEIVAFVSDVLFFYFDNQATQTYLQTATVRSAVTDIAKQFGFVPATATSSSGNAQFTVTGAGTINRGFRVRASNGEEFFLTNDIVAIAAGTVTGSVLQGRIVNEDFVSEGTQNEEIELSGPNIIRDLDNTNPADISPQVTVSGNDYTLVNSFIRHNGEDTAAVTDSLGNVIGGGGRVFLLDERDDGTPFIRFGDGIFGRKLAPGETVSITYRTGGGTAGNIAAETLNTLVDSNVIVSSVNNSADFSGGADEQTIEQLRELIPASLRTLDRAVSLTDYPDLLESTFTEVFAASAEENKTDPGVDLNIYVVPQGNGIPKISNNNNLKNTLSNYVDRRKTVTVQFQIEDAFQVDALITLEVFVTETASRSTVTQAIESALEDFFDLNTGGPGESGVDFAQPILIKNICNVVENINGVDRFEIKRLTYRPRIDANIVGLTSDYNTTEVTIFPNVGELEWLAGSAGEVSETSGTVNFDNTGLIDFTYTSSTGVIQYAFPVDLDLVAPGDLFKDSSGTGFTIFAVDTNNNNVTISTGQTVDTTSPSSSSHGSVDNGPTTFESYKVFKKIRATTTNLSQDSITDTNLDLSIQSGTGSAISSRLLLDNSNVFIPDEFATGDFYLVDASGNIWEIEENNSNTITTSSTAVNDAGITSVSSGDYSIVNKLVGSQVVFNGNIFNVQYNNKNTLFSVSAQFNQIGTIGDSFQISDEQSNIGNHGVALDLISHESSTGKIRLNGSPNLQGINTEYSLIDSDGQIFNIVAVDNESKPLVQYESTNKDDNFLLEGSGLGSQVAQGFKVNETDTYAAVSWYLKREGNILGNLVARIVNDDGSGLPDLGSIVATSDSKLVTDIGNSSFEKVVFTFATPPSLVSGTQYHLVLSGDSAYNSSESSGNKSFDNTGLVSFTYTSSSGVIQYGSSVDLSSVETGHFFKDGGGNLFEIQSVDNGNDQVTINTGETVNTTVSTSDDGSIIINDRILVGIDNSAPTYGDGEFSRFNGSVWSNSTDGPSQFTSDIDAIFTVEGTRSITIDSDLTPVLGEGATATTRYYDDENQISMIIGHSSGTVTSATDVDAEGKGTVGGSPNRNVDKFIFRTSRFSDDIVNLRLNEIPQISTSDIKIDIFGGVE